MSAGAIRRILVGAVLATAVAVLTPAVVLVAPAGAQETGDERLVVEGIDATGFPLVRAIVDGPALLGEPDDFFTVIEDGKQVSVDVVRLRSDELNVAVAIDVSGSMEGEALAQAKAAFGQMLDALPADVPVAVVAFGEAAVVSHDFSTDHDSLRASVDQLVAAGGTALYDGVAEALHQLRARGGTGALIVLSDGADSKSTTTPAQAEADLASSGVTTSFVALKGSDFDPAAIQFLADAASGQMVTVDQAAEFQDALASVAAGLTGSYELRWKSQSGGTSGEVSIALADDESSAVTKSFPHSEVRVFVPDVADDVRTVDGPGGPLSASWIPLAGGVAVSLGVMLLFVQMRSSEAAVERRAERRAAKEAEVAVAGPAKGKKRSMRSVGVQDRLNEMSAKVLERGGRGRSLDDQLDRAGLAMRSNEFVVVAGTVVLGGLLVGVVLFGVPYFVLGGILPGIGVPAFLKFKIRRRSNKFQAQLGDTLQLMAGSLMAGYGLGQTLDSVAKEAESPTKEEFSRVVMETRLGRTLEDALDAMSIRLGVKDFDWVVDAIKIQSSVGGNLSEIIQQVGETIRARTRIRRQIDALTAEGKISALVLFVLPFGLLGFIFATNPGYITPMFSSGLGQVLLGVAMVLLSIGGLWLKKLVSPEF